MNIAVLSGKGGTGKTTVSTNLSLALKSNYIDCDVEEPNGFLFLNPKIYNEEKVMVEYPTIDKDKCTNCGKCVETCEFNALAKSNNKILLFDKLCHGCGACQISCKFDAISYKKRETGKIQKGSSNDLNCIRGVLNVGEPMAVPVIKTLLKNLPQGINLIDCPPGTSCNVVNALNFADVAILVTEPSQFGLHDLKMAVELVKLYKIPFCIVLNKDDEENNIIKEYCKNEKIILLGSIPYDKEAAKIYSKGEMLYSDSNYKHIFDKLSNRLKEVLPWN